MKITLSNIGKAGIGIAGATALGFLIVVSGPPKPMPGPQTPDGPTYYVRTDGSNSNTGLANTAGGAWLTIDWAADRVVAGDTVRVQAGTYAARVTPANSGTDGNPITFVADGVVTFCGIDITSDSYLRWIGFVIDTNAGSCVINNRAVLASGTNSGLEFWHNTFRDARDGITGSAFADRQHNTIVIGNTFTALTSGGTAVGLRGNHNIIAYNEVNGPNPDAFVVDGTYNRWLNNYIHNASDAGGHSDIFQSNASSLGLQFNTFEANLIIGTGTLTDEHGVLLQNQSTSSCSTGTCDAVTENLFRRNVWHNISGGAISANDPIVGTITSTRIVHDTFVEMMRTAATTAYGIIFRGTGTTVSIHNNLLYENWGDSQSTNVQGFFVDTGASITSADYNLAYDPDGAVTYTTPWTSQANELSNVDPTLTNAAGDDFTIGSGSGARNAGGSLATTSGGGTGTTFNVVAGGGGWFRGPNTNITTYGGNLTAGDVITVGTDTVTVVSVSTDAITVTPSFTWADGEAVYLGDGTTPDIGAYPYKAGGYALSASYAIPGAMATITPNDASLVRFVVCYSSGVPYAVDNSSPYTCSAPSGTFSARVYPRFPNTTLWAVATP